MNGKTDERVLRKIYSEVIAGYSLSVYNKDIVYIKHFNPIDLLEFDFKYQQTYAKYINGGIASEEEKIQLLIRDGLWDEEKEKKIKETRDFIDSLYSTKSNQYAPKDIKATNAQIEENQKFLMELMAERIMLIGDTAETMAKRSIDTEQIIASFYKNSQLTEKLFSEDTSEVDDEELDDAFGIYEQFGRNTSDLNIRKISVSQDFQSMFHLTDNLFFFYGRPVSQLTNYQIRLARYGSHYKGILYGEIPPPSEIRDDPDALEDWACARANVTKIIEKNDNEGKNTSLFGVSKAELRFLGIEVEGSNKAMKKLAADSENGELSLQEMQKHGLI